MFHKIPFKTLGLLALSVILAFHLTGCNSSDYAASETTTASEKVVEKAPCSMEIIGAENYEGDENPHFSLFKKEYETDRWRLYGTYICDGKEKSTHLSKGDYTLYSRDIGKYEFSVDDLDREYTIVVDYNNNVLDFH